MSAQSTLDTLQPLAGSKASVKAVEKAQDAVATMFNELKPSLLRPTYFEVVHGEDGRIAVQHIQFISPETFAELCGVRPDTVYQWISKATRKAKKGEDNTDDLLPTIYRLKGKRAVRFELSEAIRWVKGQPR